MKTVLIIGGYGQFGARLSQRLSDTPNVRVLVAGRTLSKAKTLCVKHGGNLEPVLFDIQGDLNEQITRLAPDIIVDAAGPFQNVFQTNYALPKACLIHKTHYLDLSDSGTFTQGISQFNTEAKKANIAMVSGASSVPALSSAVTDAAKHQFHSFDSIEGGISPGGKIDIGLSVTQAVLSYLGKPLRIFKGGEWNQETGFSRVHKHTVHMKGEKPLHRKFGLCDAPDLILFPEHYDVQTVRFYGSQELWIIHISLRLLAWLQKHGLVKNLQTRAKFFQWWGTVLGKFASERGGMYMHFTGLDQDKSPQSLQWNLIADAGDGPFIPILAAEILIRRWLNNSPTAGARSAISEISLTEFETAFKTLAIKSEFASLTPAPYLFAQVLGDNFKTLPPAVQEGHKVLNTKTMHGRVDITRGSNPLTNIVANIIGFAKTQTDAPISITMDVRKGKEIWTRTIDGKPFRSTLSLHQRQNGPRPNEIYEQFGPIKFKMLFRIEADKLHYDIVSASVYGILYPKSLLPKSVTHERQEAYQEAHQENGKFIFDVDISFPLLGRLIAYKGWLE